MVRTIEPGWTVESVTPTSGNYHHVAHVAVETRAGTRECVLKASADGRPAIHVETRLLAILHARTEMPVPDVLGVVDAHEDVPAPFFLMETMPGSRVHRTEMNTLPEGTVERIARSSGRHLAELHSLDAVGAFGYLECPTAGRLHGDRPSVGFDEIVVSDPEPTWPGRLRKDAERWLDEVASTRFADLVSEMRPVIESGIDDLTGPFCPALGHIDNALENLLFERATGEVTAMLDWEFTIATVPANDLVCVERSLSGGPWTLVPAAPDYQQPMRRALIQGYSEGGGSRTAVEQFHEHHDLYELLSYVRLLLHGEDWVAEERCCQPRQCRRREKPRGNTGNPLSTGCDTEIVW
jgi:aminoglycoside phosphotransferase (APT) family kinase protein